MCERVVVLKEQLLSHGPFVSAGMSFPPALVSSLSWGGADGGVFYFLFSSFFCPYPPPPPTSNPPRSPFLSYSPVDLRSLVDSLKALWIKASARAGRFFFVCVSYLPVPERAVKYLC